MKKLANTTELKDEILALEMRLVNEREALKKEFKAAYESITIPNLIKRTARQLATSPEFKHDFINMVISLSAGLISRKVVEGHSTNPFRKFLAAMVQAGVTNTVSKNADGIKATGLKLLRNFFGKKVMKGRDAANQPARDIQNRKPDISEKRTAPIH